tara:strand:+ start:34232 stop:36373 length:2142 start_codon:yes stop_codon:yes gene_type:complete
MPADQIVNLGLVLTTPIIAIAGAGAVSIPLAIHLLFRRKRRTVEWAAMQFVLQAWAARRRRVRLEQIILLVLRCAVPLLLGLALSQPLLDQSSWLGSGSTHHYIVIDNGASTHTSDSSNIGDFESVTKAASEYIRSATDGDRVTIIETTGTTPIVGSTTILNSASAFVDSIERTGFPTDFRRSLNEAVVDIESGTNDSLDRIVVFSPFRSGSMHELDRLNIEFPDDVELSITQPVEWSAGNTRIESVDPIRRFVFMDPDERESGRASMGGSARVHLVRDHDDLNADRSTIVADSADGSTETTWMWQSGQSEADVEIQLPMGTSGRGLTSIHVRLMESDSNQLDDSWYLDLDVADRIGILLLDPFKTGPDELAASSWIEYALDPTELDAIDIRRMPSIAVVDSDFHDTDVVIVANPNMLSESTLDRIVSFVDSGGVLMIFPPSNMDVHPWTEIIERRFDLPWSWQQQVRTFDEPEGIETTEDTDSNLNPIASDLPALLESIKVDKSMVLEAGEGSRTILRLGDGTPLLITSDPQSDESGSIIHFSISMDPSWSDLPMKPLMVPLMQELIRNGLSARRGRGQKLVGDPIVADGTALTSSDGRRISIDRESGVPVMRPDAAGHWMIEGPLRNTVGNISLNIHPGSTSTRTLSPSDITSIFGSRWTLLDASTTGDRSASGSSLTRLLLLLLLAVLVLETLLSRFFSHSTPKSSSESV